MGWLTIPDFRAIEKSRNLMITVYKSTENGLETRDQLVNGCWVSLIDPTREEIASISDLCIPQDYFTYSLDVDERPRTEKDDNGVQIIFLRIPYFQGKAADIPYSTIPIGLILTPQALVTVCKYPNDILVELASSKLRGLSTGKRNRFILRLLLLNANKYLAYLREINKIVDVLEDKLQKSSRNNEVLEILKYQKSLVFFTTALKGNELLLERLQRSQLFHMYPDDDDLLDDVIIENQQAIEMVNISNNILSSMMDAFASIISNNLNEVMKFLASVTIVLSLPAIVVGFFGMNVQLPFQGHPLAALMVLGISLAVSAIVIFIFYRRDWF